MSLSSAINKTFNKPDDITIKSAVNLILQGCDFTSMTLKTLRFELEKQYQCNFDDKKDIIREELEKYLEENAEIVSYSEKIKTEKTYSDKSNHNKTESSDNPQEIIAPKKGRFNAVVQLSNELSEFLGVSMLPRTEVTKRIWNYIKENNLQNPLDRREILCDETLEKVLKRKSVNMFKMTKILSTLMKSYDELQSGINDEDVAEDEDEGKGEGSSKNTKKKNKKKQGFKERVDKKLNMNSSSISAIPSSKKRKIPSSNSISSSTSAKKIKTTSNSSIKDKTTSTFGSSSSVKTMTTTAPAAATSSSQYIITEGLAKVLAISQYETRPQLVKKMWDYIRQHNLQNPQDKRKVLLDLPLQNIFKVKEFTIFSMNKYIAEQMHKSHN